MPGSNETNRSAPLYQSDLAQARLPETLLKIHRYRVPGVIECRRGDETKRIYLDEGRIIFATSNQVTESFGDKLVREGRITQAEYDASVRMMKVTGMRHGVTLVEMGLLTRDELFDRVRNQLGEIIDSMFDWTSGAISFTPGRDKEKATEFVRLDRSIPDAIMRGIRSMSDGRALVERLGPKATLYERTGNTVEGLTLAEDERRLIGLVDGKRTLFELITSTPDSGANARILYALTIFQLIARRDARVKVQIRIEGPAE